ncbi:MAG: hypothetical protein LLG05_08390, partial [Porphyromonadaceae bacterium]|nr:hypothetical protein [Porphyromonadaceae bacterium]
MNFIKRMLISFLNKEIEAIKEDYLNSSLSVKIRERDHNKEVEKQATQRSIMIDEIGQKVIYCSNEWEDPLFGTIVGVTELESYCPQMYIVEDALT